MQDNDFSLDDIYTISDFAARYPQLISGDSHEDKVKAIRWLIFKAECNGLAEHEAIIGKHKATRIVAPRFLAHLVANLRAA